MSKWWEHASPGGPCVIGPRIGKNGYARFPSGQRGTYLYAHRVVWEAKHGPIPEGAQIHHVCRTKACINVEHLELKRSFAEHMREHPPRRKCDHDDDRYIDSRGKSVCRVCQRRWQRERYAERVHG
jgi:hypothetical protein